MTTTQLCARVCLGWILGAACWVVAASLGERARWPLALRIAAAVGMFLALLGLLAAALL